MNAKSNWKNGQQVNGTYCGIGYTGKINSNTRPTPDYKNVIFCVDLDNEIIVFGKTRKTIEVWSNGNDTIN